MSTTASAEPTSTTARPQNATTSQRHASPPRLRRRASAGGRGCAAGLAFFGGACMSRSRLPVAHDGSILQADRVQPILVEQHLAAVGRRQVERLHHDDRVGRADLDAQLAELAGVELEREASWRSSASRS